jgi:hypothetical protein
VWFLALFLPPSEQGQDQMPDCEVEDGQCQQGGKKNKGRTPDIWPRGDVDEKPSPGVISNANCP